MAPDDPMPNCRLFYGSAALNGTDGCLLASVAGRVRPVELGHHRYAHGDDRGVWPRLMAYLQADPDLSAALLASTVVRAHMSTAGAPKNKGMDPALDRSRGGFGSQIHMLAGA